MHSLDTKCSPRARLTQRCCGSNVPRLAIALAATLWSCWAVNALAIALARHDAPLDGNGELVAHRARLTRSVSHRLGTKVLRQQCAQARPGREVERAVYRARARSTRCTGPGPGRTVGVLPSTHAPMTRRRGNSSEPGLGLDGNGQGVAHRARSTRRRNFSCVPGPVLTEW